MENNFVLRPNNSYFYGSDKRIYFYRPILEWIWEHKSCKLGLVGKKVCIDPNLKEHLHHTIELGSINIACKRDDSVKNLRWIQMTWVGANKYTSAPVFPAHIILTSASGAYGCVISEYIVSGILALYKNLFSYRAQMKCGGWNKIEGDDTLEGKRVLILGTGNIGQETAKSLDVLGLILLEYVVRLAIGICLLMKYIQ